MLGDSLYDLHFCIQRNQRTGETGTGKENAYEFSAARAFHDCIFTVGRDFEIGKTLYVR